MARSWSWVGQYALAILFALGLGTILSNLPLLKHTLVGQAGLNISHVARFISYVGALVMLWLLARRASHELPPDGAIPAFLRSILTPAATVAVILLGYKLLTFFHAPVAGKTGSLLITSIYSVGVIGAAAWLTWVWMSHAGLLIDFFDGRPWMGESGAPAGSQGGADRNGSTTASLMKGPDGTLVMNGARVKATLGRYEIVKELGRGSMGVVYLGKDPTINRSVAIKTMRLDQIDDPEELKEFKERFFREAESTGRLSHPNIVTIYDAGEQDDLGFIAMELLEGKGLDAWCRKENLLPVRRVIEIIAKVAQALNYAHDQGIVHRDIKPANIMIGAHDTIKVMDFGIARMTTCAKTQTKVILGTPSYMSPEQLTGATIDGQSDIFSLGVVLYELMTGEKPFEADTIPSLMFKIAHEPYRSPT